MIINTLPVGGSSVKIFTQSDCSFEYSSTQKAIQFNFPSGITWGDIKGLLIAVNVYFQGTYWYRKFWKQDGILRQGEYASTNTWDTIVDDSATFVYLYQSTGVTSSLYYPSVQLLMIC